MMKTWIKELEKALSKNFYEDEVKDIVSFYTEIIEDRKAQGESMDDILSDYDIKDIVKSMTPSILMKRVNDTYSKTTKSMRQLLLLLLSTPILLPLGILYIVMIIVAISLIIASFSIFFSSIVGIVALIVEISASTLGTAEMFGLIGISLMGFSFAILISIWLYKIVWILSKKLLVIFSKLAKRGDQS
jgi:uncharacterized membrane protein